MKTVSRTYRSKAILFLAMSSALLLVWLFLAMTMDNVHGVSAKTEIQAPTADLIVDQIGPNSAFANDIVVYTLLLTNTGSTTLSNIVVTDTQATKMAQDINKMWDYGVLMQYLNYSTVPAGVVSSHTYNVDEVHKRGELTLYLNPVAAQSSVRIMISARVPITLQPALNSYLPIPSNSRREVIGPSTVENAAVAVVQGEQHNAPLATTMVLAPLMTLEKSAQGETTDVNECRVGRLVTYTLTVKNAPYEGSGARADTHPASHLVVWDQVPEQIADNLMINTTSVPGTTNIQIGRYITWTFPSDFTLEPGDIATITLVGRVPYSTTYEPSKYYLRSDWENFVAHADALPFRDAAMRSDHTVRIRGPLEKTVVTGAPLNRATHTFPNQVVTYTLTFYNPLFDQALTDLALFDTLPTDAFLPDALTFVGVVDGDLGNPQVTDATLLWENIPVPANGSVSTDFQVFVHPQVLTGRDCGDITYQNAISATFNELLYKGHDNNRYAPVVVTRQIDPVKNAEPAVQIAGSDITYTISLRNVGDTPINPPLAITDEIASELVYVEMLSDFPGEPTLVSETASSRIYRWDNVLEGPIAPGETAEFSYLTLADQVNLAGVPNFISGYHDDTSICNRNRKVVIKPAVHYHKVAGPEVVVQGETLEYTVTLTNLSPRNPFTVTEFADHLENSTIKGTRDASDGDELYEYVLPTPYRLDPLGDPWEHTFPAILQGYGIGESWCEILENPPKGIIYQLGSDIMENIDPGGWFSGLPNVKIAPFCAMPHVSLYQEVYPNPISVGQVFSVVLTLRDNRADPPAGLSGINLTWNVPLTETISGAELASFKILSSSVPPTEEGDGYCRWEGLSVPAGGATSIVLFVQAPMYEKPGWSRGYGNQFVAEVDPLSDPSICIPHAERFVYGEGLPQDCTGKVGPLVMNQGIELDKSPDQREVPPFSYLTYRIIARNLTGAPVQNVMITDTLPSLGELHWQYVSMVNGPEPVSTDPLVWIIDEIPAQDRVDIFVKVLTHQFLGFEYNQVDGVAPIHLGLSNSYTDHVEVKVISGVGFFKAAEPDHIQAGMPTTYTITLSNGSDDTLNNVVITDTLPDGFTYSHMIAPALDPVVDGQMLVWHLSGEVRPDHMTQLVYGVTTDSELFSGRYDSILEASATNAATSEMIQLPASEEAAPVYIQGVPQVLAEKMVSPDNIYANQTVTYTITLFNETDTTHSIVLTDTLPSIMTFLAPVGSTPSPAVIPGEQDRLVWSGLGTIGPAETITLTFQAQPDYASPSNLYCNDVQVQMSGFVLPKRTPEQGCVRVMEMPHIDVLVSKDDGNVMIEPGDLLEYTITYTNSPASELPVQGIILTDTFVSREYVDSFNFGSGWQAVGNDYVYINSDPLAPGASETVSFSAQLTTTIPEDIDWIENRVTVAYTTTEDNVEVNLDDNQAIDWSFFRGPDLYISDMQVTPDTVSPGQDMTVNVIVTNQGSPITKRWDGSQDNPYELFAVELYLRNQPSTPPEGPQDHTDGWERGEAYLQWIDGRLGTGESVPVAFTVSVPPGGIYDVYAQVDVSQGTQTSSWDTAWGLILETNENNNISAAYPLEMSIPVYLPIVMRH